jgi:hypothetical protein
MFGACSELLYLLLRTPARSYSYPVERQARDGPQIGDGQIALTKLTPPRISRSKFGVLTPPALPGPAQSPRS